jgi:hypothetical protein
MTIDEDQFSVNITTCTTSSSSRVLTSSVDRITLLQCFISTSYHSVVQPFNSHHHGRRKKRSSSCSSSSPRPTPPAARSDVVDAPHFRLDDNDIENMDRSDEDYRGDDEDASSLCSTSIMDEDEETDDWSGDEKEVDLVESVPTKVLREVMTERTPL